jgi:tyrosyl-tRNA synthetase
MILQSYDFYKLNKDLNCLLQIGGSDQWGNIVNGVELIRKINQKESIGITTPLITLASGAKMGKSEKGAIWLDKNLYSPYDYWQFWRNTADEDVVRFLKYFTEIANNKIDEQVRIKKNINDLKILLANETTKILHGEIAAKKAEKTAKETFQTRGTSKDLPEIIISSSQIKNGVNILDLLNSNKITSSKSEARRAINNKAIKINDKLITDEKLIINLNNFDNKNLVKISFGKKKHFVVKII